jgi:hypothetical protein
MSLEVCLQQIRFDLSWVVDECAFKYEVAAQEQVLDLAADDFFEPARVEESARPAMPGTDSLLPRALATTGLTDVYHIGAALNPWNWLWSADYIHAMLARNTRLGSLKSSELAGWIAPALPLHPCAPLLEMVRHLFFSERYILALAAPVGSSANGKFGP